MLPVGGGLNQSWALAMGSSTWLGSVTPRCSIQSRMRSRFGTPMKLSMEA